MASPRLLQQLHENYTNLPKAQQQVADIILQNPQQAIASTVEQLADAAKVSMPTIVRTCRAFGFSNVRDFMMALAQDVALWGSCLHRSVTHEDSSENILDKIINAATASMEAVQRQLDISALEAAAKAIATAERIDCYSAGATSMFIANDLQARLFRLGLSANSFFDAHQQLVSACTLGKKGVAIAISHVGRMPTLLEASRFARSQGATVIALTQPTTLLSKEADILLGVSVPEDAVMRVGTEAYIAHLLVIEILTVLVAQRLGGKAVERLRKFRSVLEEHGIDSESHTALTMGWSKDERRQE